MSSDDAPVGRILTRREALSAVAQAGAWAALVNFAGRNALGAPAATQPAVGSAVHLIASPALTEGPFFVDEHLNRSDLTTGTSRATVVKGMPLALAFTIYKLTDKSYAPMSDAHVDVWHADAAGVYSDEDHPMNHQNTSKETWLRGYQVTDSSGAARFRTIIPGWYEGRTPHIHFKVRQYDGEKATKEFTSQLFFEDAFTDGIYVNPPYSARGRREGRNSDDGIYMEQQADGTVAGKTLTIRPVKAAGGYSAEYAIVLTEGSLEAPGSGRDRFRGPPRDWDR